MTFKDQTHGLLGNALNTFGEPVVYVPQGRSAVSITAIFDAVFEELDPNTGAIIVSKKPVLGIREADLSFTPREGDNVLIRETNYRVVEVMTDGQGGSQLRLHKA